jgi:hypothetical protein
MIFSAVFLVLAVNMKTQTLVFIPAYLLMFITSASEMRQKIRVALLFSLLFILINLPFILSDHPFASINAHISAAGRHNYISVNAFNIWWALFGDYQLKLQAVSPPNHIMIFDLISRKDFALVLFSMIYLYILFIIIKVKTSPLKLMRIIAFLCFSYYMFLPEMHERYLLPFFIFSAYIASKDMRELIYYIPMLGIHTLNLFWGWGGQMKLTSELAFECTRALALISFFIWCAYTLAFVKNLKTDPDAQMAI